MLFDVLTLTFYVRKTCDVWLWRFWKTSINVGDVSNTDGSGVIALPARISRRRMRPRFPPGRWWEQDSNLSNLIATKIERVRNDHGSGLEWVLSFLHRFLQNNFNARLYRLGNNSINSIEFRRLMVCFFLISELFRRKFLSFFH
jgi:hypothetical protein